MNDFAPWIIFFLNILVCCCAAHQHSIITDVFSKILGIDEGFVQYGMYEVLQVNGKLHSFEI